MPKSNYAIEVDKLTKRFGDFTAVNEISFRVKRGELFGLLGPNGAGKTTTIKMLTTILKKSSGNASVDHYDIDNEQNKVRDNIGIVFQDPSLDDKLTGRENLEFHAMLYRVPKEHREKKIDEVLKLVELEDKQDVLVENYSGGMKRRLEIGRGFIHDPEVLFLDEPTIGLDVQTRRKIWEYIKRLNKEKGVTMVLTTHYIEEADYLCERVAFIDHGKIVALDTPEELKSSLGGDVVSLGITGDEEAAKQKFKSVRWIKGITVHDGHLELSLRKGEERIPDIISTAQKLGIKVSSVHFHKPSLEDVFIHFTGKTIREEEGGMKDRMRAFIRMRTR